MGDTQVTEMIDKLDHEEYDLIIVALRQLLVAETCRLSKENASDREWTVLNKIDSTLIKCQFIQINLKNNGQL